MGSNKRAGSASKVRIDKFEDLFGGSAEQESSAEQIINAPLTDLHTFKDHPSGWKMMRRWRKQRRVSASTGCLFRALQDRGRRRL